MGASEEVLGRSRRQHPHAVRSCPGLLLIVVSLLLSLGPFLVSFHSFSPYWDFPLLCHLNFKLAYIAGDLQFWHIGEAWWCHWCLILPRSQNLSSFWGSGIFNWSFYGGSSQLSPTFLTFVPQLVPHICPGSLCPDTVVEPSMPGADPCTLH